MNNHDKIFCYKKFKAYMFICRNSKGVHNSYLLKCCRKGNGSLFHMTQPTSRSTVKAIACSKPNISEN